MSNILIYTYIRKVDYFCCSICIYQFHLFCNSSWEKKLHEVLIVCNQIVQFTIYHRVLSKYTDWNHVISQSVIERSDKLTCGQITPKRLKLKKKKEINVWIALFVFVLLPDKDSLLFEKFGFILHECCKFCMLFTTGLYLV